MQSPASFYTDQIQSITKKLNALTGQSTVIAYSRGGLALLAAGSIYVAITWSGYLFFLVTFLIGWFLVLVKKSTIVNREIDKVQQILTLNKHELALLQGDKSVFDQGTSVDIKGHLYALDLDLFGKGSLFQSINRTTTKEGLKLIIGNLLNPPASRDEISQRKLAIGELASAVEWRQTFYGLGSLSGEKDHNTAEMALWTDSQFFFERRRPLLILAAVMSCLSGAFIAWMIITSTFYVSFFILLIVNSIVLLTVSQSIKTYFKLFGNRTIYYQKFSELFHLVDVHPFTSALGKELQQRSKEASVAFRKLSSLSNAADQRLGLLGPLMNSLFYFDIWNIYKIEKWRAAHGKKVNDWIATLGHVDMLNSFANFSFNHPGFTEAILVENQNLVSATKMGHPLIAEAIVVKNDYEIGTQSKAHIITGSNMAGKSTFIRGVGLNVLLAMNGVPVCAEKFSCSIMQIISCIRITDSLEEDASYFKAELTRLSQLIEVLKKGNPCLVLLDEILRGTNSDDKRYGTMAFYKKLASYNCLALLATHDLTVGQLEKENPGYFENFCFESSVVEGQLTFDYKLRKEISSSANATFLMKKMGLID